MSSQQVEDFKRYLENYEVIKETILQKEMEINILVYNLENVKGIKYEKVFSNSSIGNNDQKVLTMIEQKGIVVWQVEQLKTNLNRVDEFISWLGEPIKSIVQDKYLNGLSYKELEVEYGYSGVTIWRKVNRNVEKFIKYTNERHSL